MLRSFLAAALLLLSVTWAAAQKSEETLAGSGKPNPTALKGCLSGADGAYALTDKNGTQFYLSGSKDNLDPYVGKEVRIEGKQTSDAVQSENGFPTSNTSAGTLPTFEVNSVTTISDSCKGNGQ